MRGYSGTSTAVKPRDAAGLKDADCFPGWHSDGPEWRIQWTLAAFN